MADGTFEATVKRDALVDDLVDAIAQSRGIANPLAGSSSSTSPARPSHSRTRSRSRAAWRTRA
jgi:hypothetical protein